MGDGAEHASQALSIIVPGGSGYTIDIQPEDANNVVWLAGYRLPVAILTSLGFDATKVDPTSCRFGRDWRR